MLTLDYHSQLGIDDAMQVDVALPNFGDDFQFDLPTGGNPQDMQEARCRLIVFNVDARILMRVHS